MPAGAVVGGSVGAGFGAIGVQHFYESHNNPDPPSHDSPTACHTDNGGGLDGGMCGPT